MKYQLRSISQVHTVELDKLNLLVACEHFADYGYEYLYVYDNGKFIDAIDYHSFLSNGLLKKERPYIFDEGILKTESVEEFIENNSIWNRFIFTRNGNPIFEINMATQPELLYSVERELLAIRYLPIFTSEIKNALNDYDHIYILAESVLAHYIKGYLPPVKVTIINNVIDLSGVILSEGDIFIDCRYGKKLRKLVANIDEGKNICIYSLIERFALERLITYLKSKNVLLKMYRIPEYSDIKELSNFEKHAYDNKLEFLNIITDEEYLDAFCTFKNDREFIRSRGISKSIRRDNGIWNIQDDCNEPGIEIHNGVRKTAFNKESGEGVIHFFGPCAVLGMLMTYDHTIPSYFMKCCQGHNNVISENHGVLQGNNVLNSLIGALATQTESGDVVIIYDFFADLDVEAYSLVENVYNIFNKKTENETYFLDHPVHCNSNANNIIASYIYQDVKGFLDENKHKNIRRKIPYCDNDVTNCRNFALTHVVGLKTIMRMRKGFIKKSLVITKNTGVCVIYKAKTAKVINDFVQKALNVCSEIIILYSFDHLEYEVQKESVINCESVKSMDNVFIQQLCSYFNTYFYNDEIMGRERYKCIVQDFIDTIMIPNNLSIRLFYDEYPDKKEVEIYYRAGISVKTINQ